MYLLEELPVHP
ncbi:hypothetical protein VTH06DRAFT_7278 [Thermothelomyces fergusii]